MRFRLEEPVHHASLFSKIHGVAESEVTASGGRTCRSPLYNSEAGVQYGPAWRRNANGSGLRRTYFHRDDELEEYLIKYNDELDTREDLGKEICALFAFIEGCGFGRDSRVWKKADLFTLLVELHRAIYKRKQNLVPGKVGPVVANFYSEVDQGTLNIDANIYREYAIQGTNDRTSRDTRGAIIFTLLESTVA